MQAHVHVRLCAGERINAPHRRDAGPAEDVAHDVVRRERFRRQTELRCELASQAPAWPAAVADPGGSWWRPALCSTGSASTWAAVGVC